MQQHGGNVTAFAKEIGCSVEEVIDLSSNINFVKPQLNIDFNSLNIASYPNYDVLEEDIASLYKIEKEEIELFNGATVGIDALFRHLNLKHCTFYAPLYLEYEATAKRYNYLITQINRFEALETEVQEKSLVVFVNPSTPEGKFYEQQEMKMLMEKWIDKNCTILIDESFLDFTPFASLSSYLPHYEKLYLLKSMTKFYAAAGIRIGSILSTRKNIASLKEKEPLWKISEFDQHYLRSALKDRTFKRKSYKENQKNKIFLLNRLKEFSFIEKSYNSSSNFIMIRVQKNISFELQEHLKKSKIMVRNCHNFKFLSPEHLRIAIKEIHSMQIFIQALESFQLCR